MEHYKAITLRDGKDIKGSDYKEYVISKEIPSQEKEEQDEERENKEVKNKKTFRPKSIAFPDNPPVCIFSLPYPQRFQKKKLDRQFSKFLESFKKIHINIPFPDALEQMPNFVKFMKEVMSKKRKLEEYKIIKLTEECSAIL